MKAIRINHPGDGEQVMALAGGVFRPEMDHVIATHRDGVFLGGFAFTQYLGNSIAVHDGSVDPRWCSKELLWMCFDYAFRQLRCGVLVAPVAADNPHALALNLRAGFRFETVIRDLVRPGVHLIVLTMRETECRWLRIVQQSYLSGHRSSHHG